MQNLAKFLARFWPLSALRFLLWPSAICRFKAKEHPKILKKRCQNHKNEDTTATDEEASGWSASYTSGGITFKAHRNTADDVSNATANESEHTEIGVTFAF